MTQPKLETNPSGSYVLEILVKNQVQITIGKIGPLTFVAGYYYYIGSALNRNLLNRVKRHTKAPSAKKVHWHLDYFLADSQVQVNKIIMVPSIIREECMLGDSVWELVKCCNSTIADYRKVKNFGSSDCSCEAHLFFSTNPIFM